VIFQDVVNKDCISLEHFQSFAGKNLELLLMVESVPDFAFKDKKCVGNVLYGI